MMKRFLRVGSACVSHAGCGVPPQRTSLEHSLPQIAGKSFRAVQRPVHALRRQLSEENVTTPSSEKSDSLERAEAMKHLFAIAVLLLTACGCALGDVASDERELTQLIKDFNAALVKADTAFLDNVLGKDLVHYRPRGGIENRAQYLENRKNGRVHFDSLDADDIKIRFCGDTAIVTYRSTSKGKDNVER
jgi:uncharacterized protein DUF4440